MPRPAFLALALACIFKGTSGHAQVAGHWRFDSFSGLSAPDAGPNALAGIHNGFGSIGKDVAADVIPLLDLANTGAFRTQWQDASNCGVVRVDDANEYLRIGSDDFTIEAWVGFPRTAPTAVPISDSTSASRSD